MSHPAQFLIGVYTIGATWKGFEIDLSSDGTTFASPLTLVEMTFKDASGNQLLALSSANSGEITITDAAAWKARVEPINNPPFTAGSIRWFIKTTDSEGIADFYYQGTLQVNNP